VPPPVNIASGANASLRDAQSGNDRIGDIDELCQYIPEKNLA
jgi:hypothetical protein